MIALTAAVALWWSTRHGRERTDALRVARAHDFAGAEAGLKRAYGRDPADAEVVEALARAYQEAGAPEAEVWLSRWADLRPKQPEPLRLRMDFYRKRKDGEKVLADARRLMALDPSNVSVRRTAMGQAFSFGRFDEAEVLCRECLRDQPSDPWLRTMLAEIRRARGDPAGAAAVLDELIRENPQATGPLLGRATLYVEAGQSDKAVPLLREVFQRDPRQRRAAGYQLGLALERLGQADEARRVLAEVSRLQDVEVFSDAIQSQPDNLDLQVRLAESLFADGHDRDGQSLLESVLARDPQFRPAHAALATFYARQGHAARAADHRRRAGGPP